MQINYTTPSHSTAFSSISNLKRKYPNLKIREIEDTLASIPTYTLHREAKRVKHHNPFFIYKKRAQIQMDLIDVSNLSQWNNGVKFLLVAIDTFSKKAWVEELQNKKAVTTLKAIESIIQDMQTPPKSIFFDRGKEFVNEHVRQSLLSQKIKIYHPNSSLKAAIAERFNRSLQDLIFKYMTHNETRTYVNVLPALLETYNSRGHRTLRYLSPNEAELSENKNRVVEALSFYYSQKLKIKSRIKFTIGDIVRIRRELTPFLRGYHERFNREYFEVVQVLRRMPIPTYKVKSLNNGEIIEGTFYNNELQKVLGDIWKVEKVIKRRTRNKVKQLYVKWMDFDSTHNNWINASDVTETYNG